MGNGRALLSATADKPKDSHPGTSNQIQCRGEEETPGSPSWNLPCLVLPFQRAGSQTFPLEIQVQFRPCVLEVLGPKGFRSVCLKHPGPATQQVSQTPESSHWSQRSAASDLSLHQFFENAKSDVLGFLWSGSTYELFCFFDFICV